MPLAFDIRKQTCVMLPAPSVMPRDEAGNPTLKLSFFYDQNPVRHRQTTDGDMVQVAGFRKPTAEEEKAFWAGEARLKQERLDQMARENAIQHPQTQMLIEAMSGAMQRTVETATKGRKKDAE